MSLQMLLHDDIVERQTATQSNIKALFGLILLLGIILIPTLLVLTPAYDLLHALGQRLISA